MTIPAWVPVLLAIPVLLLGEWLIKRITVLGRFYIPAPVVGGLLISVGVLIYNLAGGRIDFLTQVTAQWYTWLVTIEPEWIGAPAKSVTLPLMVGFFTCIGLNATWDVVRKSSFQVVLFLGVATLLAVLQNCIGIGLAKTLGVDPLIGLLCGSITLTGGHGTAIGFAPVLEKEGLVGAATLGAAAATMGLVMGSLIGGPVGGRLIQRLQLKSTAVPIAPAANLETTAAIESGILQDFSALRRFGWVALTHLLLLVVCIKAGAWISHFIQMTGLKFPPQIGAMVVGVLVRNAFDFLNWRWIRSDTIDVLASVALGFFLTVAMISLNLIELANAALPMLVILLTQVVLIAIFATWVTFKVMGRDYDAAVMAAGHCGFGLGTTSNAIANMKVIVEKFGPAPRAFLVIPLVGAILIDFTNSLIITVFLNFIP